jgi:hypothetical protein
MYFFIALNAASISFTDDQLEPIDLVHIGQLEPLQELKLKSASGSLQIDDFDISLSQFVNLKADTLTKLVNIPTRAVTTFLKQNLLYCIEFVLVLVVAKKSYRKPLDLNWKFEMLESSGAGKL